MSVVFYAIRDQIVKNHPTQALSDIPLEKDLSNVGWQMLAWIVRDCNPVASSSTREVLDILDAMGRGEAVCQQRKETARWAVSAAVSAAASASYASWAASAAASASAASASAAPTTDFWKRASEKLLELYNVSEDSFYEDAPVLVSSVAIRYNKGKTRWDLLPYDALDSVAQVMTQGAGKYGDRNWEKGFPWMSVFASLMRHLYKWLRGEDLDGESGLPHLSHAACNVLFLLTFYLRKSGTDDRVN